MRKISIYCVNGFNTSFFKDMDTNYFLTSKYTETNMYLDKSLHYQEINKTTMFYEMVKAVNDIYDVTTNFDFKFYRGLPFLRGALQRRRLKKQLETDLVNGNEIFIVAKSLGGINILKVLLDLNENYAIQNRVKLVTIDPENAGADMVKRYEKLYLKTWINYYQNTNKVMGNNTFIRAENVLIEYANHKNIEEVMADRKLFHYLVANVL